MKKSDIKQYLPIKEWLPFSDEEISLFQFYFLDYLMENEEKISKKDAYLLACLACETQYQMRILQARIRKENNLNIESNNRFIKSIIKFDGLIEFIVDKTISEFYSLPLDKQYEFTSRKYYSYFTATDQVREACKNDIYKAF